MHKSLQILDSRIWNPIFFPFFFFFLQFFDTWESFFLLARILQSSWANLYVHKDAKQNNSSKSITQKVIFRLSTSSCCFSPIYKLKRKVLYRAAKGTLKGGRFWNVNFLFRFLKPFRNGKPLKVLHAAKWILRSLPSAVKVISE